MWANISWTPKKNVCWSTNYCSALHPALLKDKEPVLGNPKANSTTDFWRLIYVPRMVGLNHNTGRYGCGRRSHGGRPFPTVWFAKTEPAPARLKSSWAGKQLLRNASPAFRGRGKRFCVVQEVQKGLWIPRRTNNIPAVQWQSDGVKCANQVSLRRLDARSQQTSCNSYILPDKGRSLGQPRRKRHLIKEACSGAPNNTWCSE